MFAGIGIDAATIPENWNVPSEPSWHRLIHWLLGLGENLPAAAIPDVTTLYMTWSSGTLGLDAITPKLLKWLHSWLTEIETARESEDYRQRRKPFGGELAHEEVSSLKSNLRTGFLSWCHRTPTLAAGYLQSLMHRQHSDCAIHRVLELSGAMARVAPAELAQLTIAALIPNRRSEESGSWGELVERRVGGEAFDLFLEWQIRTTVTHPRTVPRYSYTRSERRLEADPTHRRSRDLIPQHRSPARLERTHHFRCQW